MTESFDNPAWADIVLHSYRHRWGLAEGDAEYDDLERRLQPAPVIDVPTLVLHGDADRCNDAVTSAGSHFPQREAASRVAEELLSWLG